MHKLYSKSRTGQLLEWEIIVEGDSFYTREGVVGGKITESLKTVCLPTNEGRANARTAEQQAIFEAGAKWKKKVKSGYATDINAVGKKFIDPQRAKSTGDYPEALESPSKYIYQKKLNGGRGVLHKHEMKSRTGEIYKAVPHIVEDARIFMLQNPSAVIDGEMYNFSLREKLNELISIIRTTKESKLTPEFLANSKAVVEFHVYDYYDDNMPESVPYTTRMAYFRERVAELSFGPSIKVIDDYRFSTKEEVQAFFEEELRTGGEGIILRDPMAPYVHGKTKYVLKHKPVDDAEGTILEIIKGDGNWSMGAKTARLLWNGKVVDATFVGENSMEVCKDIWNNKEQWIGKVITFQHTQISSASASAVPNYARINVHNCFNDKSPDGIVEKD